MNDISKITLTEGNTFFEHMMNRGKYLRFLRQLEKEDEEERKKNEFEYLQDEVVKQDKLSVINIELVKDTLATSKSNHTFDTSIISNSTTSDSRSSILNMDDKIDILPMSKQKVLRYESYLHHQRYSDDYKHCNCDYVDYPVDDSLRLIAEQQRSLGKGGLIWDAGVVLADHMILNEKEWKPTVSSIPEKEVKMTRVVELGAGTGLTGMAIAKAVDNTEVTITDLQELLPLMQRNIERNFHPSSIAEKYEINKNNNHRGEAANNIPCCSDKGSVELCSTDACVLYDVLEEGDIASIKSNSSASGSKIKASVLRWGVSDDYKNGPYDVIIGGDVVASLYDPKSLAKTIYDLCHDNSHVYLSLNRRLFESLVFFEDAMKSLFYIVDEVEHKSRRTNSNVFILHAMGKR